MSYTHRINSKAFGRLRNLTVFLTAIALLLSSTASRAFSDAASKARDSASQFDTLQATVEAMTLIGAIPAAVGADAVPSFAPAQNYSTGSGSHPLAVAVGYLNGDTYLDLVFANVASNSVTVLLNNGDGTFGAATQFPAGGVAAQVVVADFNRDGKSDVAVTPLGSVAVLLGNGDGTLGPAINSPAGPFTGSPYSLTAADFNSDGNPDVAVSIFEGGPGVVSVHLGNGNGTFGTPVEFAVGNSPLHMTVADINGDGILDLAVANADSANVSVLAGNGNGAFQSAVNFAVGFDPRAVAAGDFNSDGKLDLVVANGRSNNDQVLLNDGTGTLLSFQSAVIYPTGLSPVSVVVDDFNGDGKGDIASADADSNIVSVLTSNVDGAFQDAVPFDTGSIPFSIATGDFNGDAKPDLVTANRSSANASVLLNDSAATPTPTLGAYPNTSIPLSANTSVTPDAVPTNTTSINVSTSTNFKGKLEGDPTTGIVRVTDAHPAGTYLITVTAFGTGGTTSKTFALTVTTPATCNPVSFTPAANFDSGANPRSVAIGDFNGDGKQDLATSSGPAAVSVLLGNGAGSFGSATNFAVGITPESVMVGDFNGDGNQDLVTANANFASQNVSILLGDGAGGFSAPTNYGIGFQPRSVVVGDFNGDGKQDLAAANENSHTLSILLGNGTGTFSPATNIATQPFPFALAIGDFNSDGNQDLVATIRAPISVVSIFLGDGTGGFNPATNFGVDNDPLSVAVGDFNGDGQQDLATANQSSDNVSVLLGDGTGAFSPATNFAAGGAPQSVAVGDLNGDGNQDLVVGNGGTNDVSVLLGNGAGGFSVPANFGAGSGPTRVAVGDFNGDGKQDLVTSNIGSHDVSVLLRQCVPTISPSMITVSAPPFIANGDSVVISGVLTGVSNAPLANQPVTFSLGSGAAVQTCMATTDVNGLASCTITVVNQPLGPNLPVGSAFAGNSDYLPSSASTTTLVFAYAAGNGAAFVIGNLNSAVGATVTYWGAQWTKLNLLSDGSAPNSFKGFANRSSTIPAGCGSTWTTDPGKSSNPPSSVPAYMAVIVSSSITKSGSTISGNTVKVVIVRTNAGYDSSPGHAGTGTVVGIICQ